MSFDKIFDGYCLIDAPFVKPSRHPWFDAELRRIGVENYTTINAEQITPDHPELVHYTNVNYPHKHLVQGKQLTFDPCKMLSHTQAFIQCIETAKKNGWKSVVTFENDIIFRNNFHKLWNEVEPSVLSEKWDILFLYRWNPNYILESRGKTGLVPILSTLCLHCFVVKESCYDLLQEAFRYTIETSSPPDSFRLYEFLNKKECKIFATSKNLAGQKAGFISGHIGNKRVESLRGEFNVESRPAWVVKTRELLKSLNRFIKRSH